MSYDAVFELDYNKETEGGRYGVAKNLISAKVADGGEIIPDVEKLIVTDYTPNPTGKAQGRNREEFTDGLTLDYEKLDFAGWLPGIKAGHGEDGKRSGEIALKEEMTVHGRVNVGLKRDNPNDGRIEMEVNFKEETENVERRHIQRTQPQADILERIPILTRTKNTETPNPRLDTTTKVRMTSDLYPWIKNKGEPEDTFEQTATQ